MAPKGIINFRKILMYCPKQLATLAFAFIAFALLPATFWGSITYMVIDLDAAKAVWIIFFLAGLYSCYRGAANRYHWFDNDIKPRTRSN